MLINIWSIPVEIFVALRQKFRDCRKKSEPEEQKKSEDVGNKIEDAKKVPGKDSGILQDDASREKQSLNKDEEWDIQDDN